jgi:alkane 1-monooxygenase
MTTADYPLERVPELAPSEVSEIWLGHLMSFLIPVTALVFVWSGPHHWYTALLFIAPMAIFHWADSRPRQERRQPVETLPTWPFDLIVHLLVVVHFLTLWGMLNLFSQQSFFSLDTAMIFVVVGASSGFSIITAHELIHRRSRLGRVLGRLILCSVLYEHFYTEHLRGHHLRVATEEDPATARFGETYRAFFRRTVPAQFRSAWRLECERLGDADMGLLNFRILRNRVLQGVVLEWVVAIGLGFIFGFVAFLAYCLQALVAVRLLEIVNYFEHWGLMRRGGRIGASDSWDTYSWFTYYGLIGLARHADHHAQPSRPYQQLRVRDEAPLLPFGYVALVDMVLARNDEFVAWASAELRRRKLGPYSGGQVPEFPPAPELGKTSRLRGFWKKLPTRIRSALGIGLFVLAISLGAQFEYEGIHAFQDIAFRNLSILGTIVSLLFCRSMIERGVENSWISWGCFFVLVWVAGHLLSPWIGLS